MPRIPRRPRTGSLAGANPQRPLRRAYGSLHSQVAILSRRAQSPPGPEREVDLLASFELASQSRQPSLTLAGVPNIIEERPPVSDRAVSKRQEYIRSGRSPQGLHVRRGSKD